MKKFLVIICIISMVASSMLNVFADTTQVVNVTAEEVTVESGTTDIKLNVNLTNNPGIATIGFSIGYDASAMTLKSVDCGEIFKPTEITPGVLGNNPYMVSALKVDGNSTNEGVIVIATFTLKADCKAGTYPVTIGDGGILGGCVNIDEQDVPLKLTSGSITVKSKETTTTTETSTQPTTTTVTTTKEQSTTTTVTTTKDQTTTTTVTTTKDQDTTTTITTTKEQSTTTTKAPVTTTETTETTTKAPVTTTETSETTTAAVHHSNGGGGGAGASSLKVSGYTSKTTTESTTEVTTKTIAEENSEVTTSAIAISDVKVTIGSKKVEIGSKVYDIDVAPYIQASSNSTLVPLRFVALAIAGGDVNDADNSKNIMWDAVTKTATISYNKNTIKFTAGSADMIINSKAQLMEKGVKAEIVDGRMFVPFRALGNALGVSVDWDAKTKTAIYKIK